MYYYCIFNLQLVVVLFKNEIKQDKVFKHN